MRSSIQSTVFILLSWVLFLGLAYWLAANQNPLYYIVLATAFSVMITYAVKLWLRKIQSSLRGEKEKTIPTSIAPDNKKDDKTVPSATSDLDNKKTILRLAKYDDVTSLPNNILFNEILNKAISHARRHHKVLAILYLDVHISKKDKSVLDLKQENKIVKQIANTLVSLLRTEDIVAKSDNNEFIILLTDIRKPKFASSVAEKILKACEELNPVEDYTILPTIGICIYPDDGSSLEDLFEHTYAALHKAKQSGQLNYQFYSQHIDDEAHEYIKMEHALRSTLEDKQLSIFYQPKIHLKTGRIVGVEALMRWIHPELGIINPNQFIPIAEDTGLIIPMGEWALREIGKMNQFWQSEGYEHLTVAFNLSPKQFNHPSLVKMIQTVLAETKLNPNYLELEINEKTIMDDIERTAAIVKCIKETGVKLSIDHFGTGYTSISHLKQLPVSAIKIDATYIKGIPNNTDDAAITNAIIALVHQLGLEVVAEGVETAEQVQFLSAHGCDIVQGYYLSHPLPANQIILQYHKLMDKVMM